MKPRLVAILVLLVVCAIAATLVWQRGKSPVVQQEKLVEQFIAILPDSLQNDRVLEVRQLFYTLRERAATGAVKPETLDDITAKVQAYVDKGAITGRELVLLMADVGYSTYKDDPRYNLEDGSVDHPELNPSSAMVTMGFDSSQYDSAFWSDFEQFKKDHPELVEHPEKIDSIMRANPRLRPQP